MRYYLGQPVKDKYAYGLNWHQTFAWLPVFCPDSESLHWLEWVYRRGVQRRLDDSWSQWEYKAYLNEREYNSCLD